MVGTVIALVELSTVELAVLWWAVFKAGVEILPKVALGMGPVVVLGPCVVTPCDVTLGAVVT